MFHWLKWKMPVSPSSLICFYVDIIFLGYTGEEILFILTVFAGALRHSGDGEITLPIRFLSALIWKKNQGLRSMGGYVTDLRSKWVSLRPAIKNTLAATLLSPWKPRAKWLFSPTIPDTIWPHVKQLHYCARPPLKPESWRLSPVSSCHFPPPSDEAWAMYSWGLGT